MFQSVVNFPPQLYNYLIMTQLKTLKQLVTYLRKGELPDGTRVDIDGVPIRSESDKKKKIKKPKDIPSWLE